MKQANEHMDSLGIPEDAIVRGLANVQLACQANPDLQALMAEMYPSPQQLTS